MILFCTLNIWSQFFNNQTPLIKKNKLKISWKKTIFSNNYKPFFMFNEPMMQSGFFGHREAFHKVSVKSDNLKFVFPWSRLIFRRFAQILLHWTIVQLLLKKKLDFPRNELRTKVTLNCSFFILTIISIHSMKYH